MVGILSTGRLIGSRNTGYFGAGSAPGLLLKASEPQGMAVDFTATSNRLLIRSADNRANYLGNAFNNDGGPVSFSRASLGTVVDSDGKIKWAPHNLLLASEQFDNAAWPKLACSVTANVVAAPDGTTTADKLVEDNTNAAHYLSRITSGISGLPTVFSVYAKAAERSQVCLQLGAALAFFNLSTGVVVSGSGASIQSVGNGWYLCTFSGTPSNNNTLIYTAVNGGATYQGDGASGIYIWGAHCYRSDLGGMVANTSAYPMYNPTTPKNLLGYTEDFSNAAWSRSNISAFGSGSVANAAVAPNGLQTADLLVPDTTSAAHTIFQSSTVGGLNVQALYVKPAGYNKIALRESQTGAYYAAFNLAGTGSVLDSSGATAAITALSDGWYRISMIGTISGTTRWSMYFLSPSYTSGSVISSWTPDGTSGIYLWGAQLSDSASLDPYVPNHFAAPSAAAYYGPRLDYDPSTLAAKGLLVEEQRTNLLTYSAEIDNAAWTKSNATVTANASVSPSGLTTADLLIADTATGNHQATIGATTTATATSFSVYAKQGGYNWVALGITDSGSTVRVTYFNIATGVVGTTATGITASIQSVGSGWYRCVVTVGTALAGSNTCRIYVSNADGVTSFTGNGTSGIYIWGAQLEAGSFATSYIPTTSASVTRSADVAQVGTSAFPYSSTSGSIVVSASSLAPNSDGTSRLAAILYDGVNTYANAIRLEKSSALSRVVQTVSGSSTVASSSWSEYLVNKIAAAYENSNSAASFNGGAASSISGTIPSAANVIGLGANNIGTNTFSGWVRQITYLPRRITNAELQARTA